MKRFCFNKKGYFLVWPVVIATVVVAITIAILYYKYRMGLL